MILPRILQLNICLGAVCLGAVCLGAFLLSSPAFAQALEKDPFFEHLLKNPRKYREALPKKYHKNKIKPSLQIFSRDQVKTRNFVLVKDSLRHKMCPLSRPGDPCLVDQTDQMYSGISEGNLLNKFFPADQKVEYSLKKLDDLDLNKGRVAVQPWSGDYWGLYKGGAGFRYASADRPFSHDYVDYRNHFKRYWPIQFSNQDFIDNLAATEKYDLLVNDSEMTLTNYSWGEPDEYFRNYGKVETWMGLCHGWAAASYMMKRPQNYVEFSIPGLATHLRFYPDDIKALQTILWANTATPTYFLGGRCNEKNPKKDENGRIISEDCFDTNPGSWHIAVVNRLGLARRSFVIDATYDYEVWNQPVVSYRYKYFNLKTKEKVESSELAIVPITDLKKDLFKKYRSGRASFLVGVIMELTYVVETASTHKTPNLVEDDALTTVRYYYDLELDENKNVIGGEWYQNAHPDMLWTPHDTAKAWSIGNESALTEWDGNGIAPILWTQSAKKASTVGQPLARIIDMLIEISSQQRPQ